MTEPLVPLISDVEFPIFHEVEDDGDGGILAVPDVEAVPLEGAGVDVVEMTVPPVDEAVGTAGEVLLAQWTVVLFTDGIEG